MRVERSKTPTEPLESEELIEKFTRPKDEKFYNQLTYVNFRFLLNLFESKSLTFLLLRM